MNLDGIKIVLCYLKNEQLDLNTIRSMLVWLTAQTEKSTIWQPKNSNVKIITIIRVRTENRQKSIIVTNTFIKSTKHVGLNHRFYEW